AYDRQGNLWVARLQRSVVQKYTPSGVLVTEVQVESPGAVRLGADGFIYAVYGDTFTSLLPGSAGGGVVRFNPQAAQPTVEMVAAGLGWANGAAFDNAGNLYVADMGSGVVRVLADGAVDAKWSDQTKFTAANGIAVRDGFVYTTLMFSGDVVRIPIDNPADQKRITRLTLDAVPVPLTLDDLTVAPDGSLYVTSPLGKLIRVDPHTGASCTALHTEPLTSVTVVPDTAGTELLVGTMRGAILRVTLAS
ncbi:MAG: hypothetical protein GX542_13010, partial [Rhodococcus sp.]|nr:hypothetical protein [Rhodococcus sp. (in: high G+C Gram-positive bacteria)]